MGENSSLTVEYGCLIALLCFLFAATVQAAQPGWWTATGGPLNSNPSNDYALANQGQLKLFTQKTVFYLDSNLPSGAGPTLDGMVAGWSNFYATNGYSSTNPAPADFNVVNQGQLKYIGSLIYGQLSGAGYTGLTPSWLQPNTNTEYIAANLGQLKTVFNFDLSTTPPAITGLTASSTTPGEVDLSWTLPAGNNATSILIEQSTDGGVTWASLGSVLPTDTSDVISYGSPPPGAVTYRATPSNSNGSAPPITTTTPTPVLPQPRYAVIDLGANVAPVKITNSGYVLLGTHAVWAQGTSHPLQLSGIFTSLTANDITEDGVSVGSESAEVSLPAVSSYSFGNELVTGATLWSVDGSILSAPSVLSDNDLWGELDVTYDEMAQPTYSYDLANYNAGVAIDLLHNVWTVRNELTPGMDTVDPTNGITFYPINYLFDSYDSTDTEMGAPVATDTPGYIQGGLVDMVKVNNQSQVLKQTDIYGDNNHITNTIYQLDSSILGFKANGLSNRDVNGTTYVVGQNTNAVPSLPGHWYNGTDHMMTNFFPSAINAAVNTTNNGASYQPAAQMVGSGYINGSWVPALMEMNPTNGVFGIPQKLDQLVPVSSGWSSIAVSGSSINDGGAIVGTASLTTTAGTTTHGVILMPMQYRVNALSSGGALQADSDSTFEPYQTQPATALKVAKWNDAFTDNDSVPALTSNFIDTDVDGVYVRISDGAHKGAGTLSGKLQISSVDSTGATIDSGNTVDLIEDPLNPGTFQTKALILVTDETDRTYTATGYPAAGANNHRLFKTPLGSTLVATYTIATGVTAVQKMVVAPQKTINLHAFILMAGLFTPTAVIPSTTVQADLEIAKQRWAQCGIQVNYTIDTVTSTQSGVSAAHLATFGFDNFYEHDGQIIVPQESKDLFAKLPGLSGEICIYYVNSFYEEQDFVNNINFGPQAATSVPKLMTSADIASGCGNRILVNVIKDTSPFAEAHELLHVLLNAQHDTSSPDYPDELADLTMLWHGPTSDTNAVTATKRISVQQAKDALTKTTFPK